MSSRPQLEPHLVITNGNLASASLTSIPTIIQKLSMVSYEAVWSGSSPSGTVSVQVSNTYSLNTDGSVKNAGDWNDLPLSISPTVSGNTGNGFIDIDAQAGYAVRFVYTRISGTGTLNVTVSGKVA